MGGLPPLGYDAKDRTLVINQDEAETVRHIYRRYAALGSVGTLKEDLERDGIVSKVRIDRLGRNTGGKPIARGALYLMLQNRIYLGEIVHKENSYPGLHEAIIDETLWGEVQKKLATNRVDRVNGADAARPSLLAGLIYDDAGDRMTPVHANKKGTRYRYYVSQRLVKEGRRNAPHGRRVPAGDLESLVEDRLLRFLTSEGEMYHAIEPYLAEVTMRSHLVSCANDLAARWSKTKPAERRSLIIAMVDRVDITRETIEVQVRPDRLPSLLLDGTRRHDWAQSDEAESPTSLTLSIPARLKRAGLETRLLIDGAGGGARRKSDYSLHRVLAQAHQYRAMVMRNHGKTMSELAAEAGVGRSYFTRILRLSFLAPDIVKAILRDDHPIDVTAKRLANEVRLPIAWQDQRTLLGIT
jgi:hypothetical protein